MKDTTLDAGHTPGQWTNAGVHCRHRFHKNTETPLTQKKLFPSYPGRSRKKTLQGILKNKKKMMEEGLPSRKRACEWRERYQQTVPPKGTVPLLVWTVQEVPRQVLLGGKTK